MLLNLLDICLEGKQIFNTVRRKYQYNSVRNLLQAYSWLVVRTNVFYVMCVCIRSDILYKFERNHMCS